MSRVPVPRPAAIVSRELLASANKSAGNSSLDPKVPQEEMVTSTLQSMADVRFIGEDDDQRLLPAIDAWLSFLTQQPATAINSFRAIDSFDKHGTTLLMVASCFGKVKAVKKLLAHGADYERVTTSSRSALVYAVLGPDLPEQKLQVIKMLLDAGARRGIGLALEASVMLGRLKFARVIITYGGLPNGQLVSLLDPPNRPDLEGALAKTTHFREGKYGCEVIFVRTGFPGPGKGSHLSTPSKQGGAPVCLMPQHLHVAPHHYGTEECRPIVAAGSNPLDVAAAALAGAPGAPPTKEMLVSPRLLGATGGGTMSSGTGGGGTIGGGAGSGMGGGMGGVAGGGGGGGGGFVQEGAARPTAVTAPSEASSRSGSRSPTPMHPRSPQQQQLSLHQQLNLQHQHQHQHHQHQHHQQAAYHSTPQLPPPQSHAPPTSPRRHTSPPLPSGQLAPRALFEPPPPEPAPAPTLIPDELPEGSVVRVVNRAEQWLLGRCGRVQGRDDPTGRYLVLVPSCAGEQPKSRSSEPLALLLLRSHLMLESLPAGTLEAAAAWEAAGSGTLDDLLARHPRGHWGEGGDGADAMSDGGHMSVDDDLLSPLPTGHSTPARHPSPHGRRPPSSSRPSSARSPPRSLGRGGLHISEAPAQSGAPEGPSPTSPSVPELAGPTWQPHSVYLEGRTPRPQSARPATASPRLRAYQAAYPEVSRPASAQRPASTPPLASEPSRALGLLQGELGGHDDGASLPTGSFATPKAAKPKPHPKSAAARWGKVNSSRQAAAFTKSLAVAAVAHPPLPKHIVVVTSPRHEPPVSVRAMQAPMAEQSRRPTNPHAPPYAPPPRRIHQPALRGIGQPGIGQPEPGGGQPGGGLMSGKAAALQMAGRAPIESARSKRLDRHGAARSGGPMARRATYEIFDDLMESRAETYAGYGGLKRETYSLRIVDTASGLAR